MKIVNYETGKVGYENIKTKKNMKTEKREQYCVARYVIVPPGDIFACVEHIRDKRGGVAAESKNNGKITQTHMFECVVYEGHRFNVNNDTKQFENRTIFTSKFECGDRIIFWCLNQYMCFFCRYTDEMIYYYESGISNIMKVG